MPSCCYGDEYGAVFTSREAARAARRFRRRGLRPTARRLTDAISLVDAGAMTMLEVGGGTGEIGVSLLERGTAGSVVNVELSTSWEEPARALLREQGLEAQVERLVGDFLDRSHEIPRVDLVVMHRVICCYPDWRQLLTAAEEKAGHVLAITVPVDRWWIGAAVRAGNLFMRIRGMSFRAYVHPPEAMVELLRSRGFDVLVDEAGWIWRTIVVTRDGDDPSPRSSRGPTTGRRRPAG